MENNIYVVIISITTALIISLDLVIILGSRNLSSKIFVVLSFLAALWISSHGFLINTSSDYLADLLIRIQYIIGILITLCFYIFSITYPYNKKPSRRTIFYNLIIFVSFSFLCLFTNYINAGIEEIGGIGRWAWRFGPLHFLFCLFFIIYWIISLKKIFISYRDSSGITRKNVEIMFLALILGITPPILTNIILPSFNFYYLNWFGPITGIIWISVIFYSIIRYHQMNIKTVIAEVLAIGMTVIFFVNIFIDTPLGIWDDVIIFLAFFILAIFLMKSILREIKQNEILKDFNGLLAERVDGQTQEIKKLYDSEKKNKRELEKLNETKDQFIMITQHHLRSPVVNIKCGLESIQSGKYGHINPKIQKELNLVNSSVDRLTKIVDDFLSITSLKAGENILNLSYNSLRPLLEDIIQELQINIEEKKILISYSKDTKDWPEVMIDPSKIRDALLIVIENAIRYNIDYGKVTIETFFDKELFKLIISDTGVGINSSDKEKIFNNLFHRSEQAKKANPNGMGIGLSVARAIIRAHHGSLELESKGEKLGTKVIIKIPKDLTTFFQ